MLNFDALAAPTPLESLIRLCEHASRPLGKAQLLDGALRILCAHFGAPGWITVGEAAAQQAFAAAYGLPDAAATLGGGACRCRAEGACDGEDPDRPRLFACDRPGLATHHLAVPLRAAGRLVGMLQIAQPPSRPPAAEDAAMLRAAARTLAGAVLRLDAAAPSPRGAQALRELGAALLGLSDAEEIMAAAARWLAQSLGAAVGLRLLRGGLLAPCASVWPEGGQGARAVPLDDPSHLAARAGRLRRPLVLAGGEPADLAETRGATAVALAAPLLAGARLLGTLEASAPTSGGFAEEAPGCFVLAAEQVALALDRADLVASTRRQLSDLAALHERSAQQTRQLSETYAATLAVLGDALELRDRETMGHTERVVALAVALGRALGLPTEDLQHLQWGAYVHDLGKIGVPDAVLRKPGPLSPDEWRLMQRHPQHGYNLLQRLLFLTRSLDVVRYHHERFDGCGYPYGLQGEEIPRIARIFMVADAYDAMTNDRPYRGALSAAEAMAELTRHAGSQFDPAVVAALQRLPPEVLRAESAALRAPARPSALQAGAAAEQLQEFADLAASLLSEDVPEAALGRILAQVTRLYDGKAARLLVYDAAAGGLRCAARRGAAQALHEELAGRAFSSAAPCHVPDVAAEFSLPAAGEIVAEFALPLCDGGEVRGVLDIGAGTAGAFPAPVRAALRAYAQLAAGVIVRGGAGGPTPPTDPVTGLSPADAFWQAAERELGRAARHGRPLALLRAGLDQVERLGPPGSPADALAAAAERVRTACRSEDLCGPADGGFWIVLPETAKVGALLLAERLRADLARRAPDALTVSVGAAALPEDGPTIRELSAAAEQAMQEAQRRGGNEIVAAARRLP